MPTGPDQPLPQELTPSEILLLRCDLFAPLPPLTRGDRVYFEWNHAAGYLIPMFFAAAFFSGATQISEDHAGVVRIVAALIFLALPAAWWYNRRSADPKLEREGLDIAFPLGGAVPIVLPEYVRQAISAALLASERRSHLTLAIEDTRLIAHFTESAAPWPKDSLEDRLRRARPIAVTDLIYDWMADGSNFPWRRASRLIDHSAILRGLSPAQLGAAAAGGNDDDVAKVRALLDDCREQRPAVWQSLQAGIDAALKSRTVRPSMKRVGNTTVPEFDYGESSLSSLDVLPPPASEAGVPGAAPKIIGTIPQLIFAVAAFGAAGVTLVRFHPGNTSASVVIAAGTGIGVLAFCFWGRRMLRHRELLLRNYGLAAEAPSAVTPRMGLGKELTLAAVVSACVALMVAWFGAWTALVPLALFGLISLVMLAEKSKWTASLSAEVVAARVRALAAEDAPATVVPATDPVLTAQAESPFDLPQTGAAHLIPDRPIPAHDLPRPSGALAAELARWTDRRARFRRLYWLSLGILVGGYALLAMAFVCLGHTPWLDKTNSFLGPFPFGLVFTLAATVMAALALRNNESVEEGQGDSRHAVPSLLIALWRVNILIQAPLLFTFGISAGASEAMQRHPYFVATVFLFLVLHWFWMEAAMARLLRDLAVPRPRRLVMLRVFGSPSFDDLVTLIGPWRRIGLIEHLEGYDTIGLRSDVRDLVDKGQVDRVLAKDMAEVQQQLDQATTVPDSALLFQRHAFQCTNATWRQAIQAMLDRGDAVLMDLSSLSFQNQGCAWELGQLLDRVPLAKVTLLVNDSTDLDCLRGILENVARNIAPNSPNRDNPKAAWQQIRIGGLSQRQPNEDYYGWKRRIDDRLDPMLLTAWLLSTAGPGSRAVVSTRWARQSRWLWLVLAVLSGMWSFKLWKF